MASTSQPVTPGISTTRGVSFTPGAAKPRDVEQQIVAVRHEPKHEPKHKYGRIDGSPREYGRYRDYVEKAYRMR